MHTQFFQSDSVIAHIIIHDCTDYRKTGVVLLLLLLLLCEATAYSAEDSWTSCQDVIII